MNEIVDLPLGNIKLRSFPLYDSLWEKCDDSLSGEIDVSNISKSDSEICLALILHYNILHNKSDINFFDAKIGEKGIEFDLSKIPNDLKKILKYYLYSLK